jgi:hypothetical protein
MYRQMILDPRRPRERRIVLLTWITWSIEEFCNISGLIDASVRRSIDQLAPEIVVRPLRLDD